MAMDYHEHIFIRIMVKFYKNIAILKGYTVGKESIVADSSVLRK